MVGWYKTEFKKRTVVYLDVMCGKLKFKSLSWLVPSLLLEYLAHLCTLSMTVKDTVCMLNSG